MKQFLSLLIIAATSLLVSRLAVSAQGDLPLQYKFSDEEVNAAIARALNFIHKVTCDKNRLCEPATEMEKATPPITREQARIAMRTGAVSGALEWCGSDWSNRAFAEMADRFIIKDKLNRRQWAILGVLHSEQLARHVVDLKATRRCTPQVKAGIEALIPEHKQQR